MPFEINGFPSCVFIGAIYCLLLFLLKETSKSQQQAYRYICPSHFNDVFSRCLQEDSAKRPSFSEIKQSLVTQVRLILLLLILDDFWMSFFFCFDAFSLTFGFGRRLKIRDHVMIMLQFLSCALHTKNGVSANHGDNGNENLAAVYRAEQWLNNTFVVMRISIFLARNWLEECTLR